MRVVVTAQRVLEVAPVYLDIVVAELVRSIGEHARELIAPVAETLSGIRRLVAARKALECVVMTACAHSSHEK